MYTHISHVQCVQHVCAYNFWCATFCPYCLRRGADLGPFRSKPDCLSFISDVGPRSYARVAGDILGPRLEEQEDHVGLSSDNPRRNPKP